jgi:hypothetical protein
LLQISREARKQDGNRMKRNHIAYTHRRNIETEQDGEMQGYDATTNTSVKKQRVGKRTLFHVCSNQESGKGTTQKREGGREGGRKKQALQIEVLLRGHERGRDNGTDTHTHRNKERQ